MPVKSIVPLVLAFCVIAPGILPVRDMRNPLASNRTTGGKLADTPQVQEVRSPDRNFSVENLAEGVYAVIRNEPPGLMVDANSVFIINDGDVVVVDANGAPSITKQVVAALRKLTDKPVRYVINTHWHDDHIRGNQVYRDAFPRVEFVGHALEKLCALNPTLIVPGHGPILRDTSYPRLLGAMFASISEQTRAAVSRGESLEQARKSVTLQEFQTRIAGDSPVRKLLFNNYVAFPAVGAAFREASAR